MAGVGSAVRRLYLSVYNWIVFFGWAQMLYYAALALLDSGHEAVYAAVERPLQFAQTAAIMENHTIQMHPTSIPHDIDGDVGSTFSKYEDETSNIECPIGSVLILRSYGVKSMRSLRPLIGYNDDENDNNTFRVAMVLTRPSPVYGSQAKLSVYEPDLGTGKPPRFSQAMLSLQNGSPPNMSMILVGWVIIRYSFFGMKEALGFAPSCLLWLRYSTFMILYPTGIFSEVGLIYIALPYMKASEKYCLRMPNKWNFSLDYSYTSALSLAVYVPGGPHMFTYMLAQRKKALSKAKTA